MLLREAAAIRKKQASNMRVASSGVAVGTGTAAPAGMTARSKQRRYPHVSSSQGRRAGRARKALKSRVVQDSGGGSALGYSTTLDASMPAAPVVSINAYDWAQASLTPGPHKNRHSIVQKISSSGQVTMQEIQNKRPTIDGRKTNRAKSGVRGEKTSDSSGHKVKRNREPSALVRQPLKQKNQPLKLESVDKRSIRPNQQDPTHDLDVGMGSKAVDPRQKRAESRRRKRQSTTPSASVTSKFKSVDSGVNKVVELTLQNGNQYQGEWLNGKPSGFGTYTWKDGSHYAGQFLCGELHGTGTKTWSSGKIYAGEWSHNTFEGSGELKFADGSRYVGSFMRGSFSGMGRREWTNGDIYTGNWKNGKHHGSGRLETAEGRCVYIGEWASGLMHGKGVAIWESEEDMSISEKDENAESMTLKIPIGIRVMYEGQWSRGLRHGDGTLRTLPPAVPRASDESPSCKDGKASKDVNIGEVDNLKSMTPLGVVVSGTFSRGQLLENKPVKLLYPDGTRYEGYIANKTSCFDSHAAVLGAFSSGLKVPHGPGKMIWCDVLNSSFEGEFVLGEPRGRGAFINSQGELRGCFGDGGLVSGPGFRIWRGAGPTEEGMDGLLQGILFQHHNEGEEMRYTGDLQDNMMHGSGRLEWPDGRVYEGNFVANRIEGQGIMRWTERHRAPNMSSKVKISEDSNQNVYKGSFVSGQFHGKGELCFATGEKYQGSFANGRFHGHGEFVDSAGAGHDDESTCFRICGSWKAGAPDGLVEIDYRGGGTYRGHVARGKYHGRGTRVWPNGDIYIGQWESSTFDTKTEADAGLESQAVAAGIPVARQKLQTAEGTRMQGPGSYLFSNGTQYVGSFLQNQRSGPGKQIWPTGHMYVGDWLNDKSHGKGVFADGASGISLAGVWAEGRLVREVIEQVVLSGEQDVSQISEVTEAAAAAKLSTDRIIAGVIPFDGHDVQVRLLDGAQTHSAGESRIRQPMKKTNVPTARLAEGVRHNQIYINPDGSLYVGTTWRGVYHGSGVLLSGTMPPSKDGKPVPREDVNGVRNSTWVMGTKKMDSSRQDELKKKSCLANIPIALKKRISHANYAMAIQKDQLRHMANRLFSE